MSGRQEITIVECIEDGGWIRYRGKLYFPHSDELHLHIIQQHHDTVLAGNQGQAKRFDLLHRGYYWEEMRVDVDLYDRDCHDCQWSRSSRHSTIGALWPSSVPDTLWEDISMQFVVGLPECEGFDATWVVVDRHPKMGHFIPCHTTIDPQGLAELFMQEVVRFYGFPLIIVSNGGPQFTSTFWPQGCSRLGIDRRISTAFHPQSDGQTERMNADMEQYLRVFVNHQQDAGLCGSRWLSGVQTMEWRREGSVLCFLGFRFRTTQMSFVGEPMKDRDLIRTGADEVQALIQQIHDHLWVGMRQSQVIQE